MKKLASITALFLFMLSSSAFAAVCPDGSYIYGDTCTLTSEGYYQGFTDITMTSDGRVYARTPDGIYVRAPDEVRMTPDGSYPYGPNIRMYPADVEGSYTEIMSSSGTYYGGTEYTYTPDAPYYGGTVYTFTPDGSYVGDGCNGSC